MFNQKTDDGTKDNKSLNMSLWIAQALLAIVFLMAGTMKATQPIYVLVKSLPWVGKVPAGLVRFIGICEFFAAVGLLLPSLLRKKPELTGWAAVGIIVIMLFAIAFHVAKGEASVIGINIMFGLVAGFIAWGRLKEVVIQPRKS